MRRPPRRKALHAALALAASMAATACSPAESVESEGVLERSEIERALDAFENRERYPVLTRAILEALPDDELEQALIDHVIDVRIAERFDRDLELVAELSDGYRMLYATWLLDAEVQNGGFNQFSWNSSGRFAAEALCGFERIGAEQHRALMEEAIAVEAEERASQQAYKDAGTLEAFMESYETTALDALDERYFALDLGDRRIRSIRAHPEEFLGP